MPNFTSFKKIVLTISMIAFLGTSLTSCQTVTQPTQQGYQGAGAGALLGAVAGALIDSHNRWQGAAIGAGLGAVAGYTLEQIQSHAINQAVQQNRQVQWQGNYNNQPTTVNANPIGYNPQTGCKTVRVRIWQGGQLTQDYVKQVCPSQ